MSTVSERDYVVGRGSGLSALHPFASGEEISFISSGFDVSCGETSDSRERAFVG